MNDEQSNISCNYNTWQNNNIAWKNIRIEPSNGVYIANPGGMFVRTRRVIDNGQPIRYRIRDDVQNPFRPKGDILIMLPDSLYLAWIVGGKQGSGFQQVGNQVLRLTESTAFLDGIHLPAGHDYSIGLAFNPFEGKPIDVPGVYLATIEQMEQPAPGVPYQVVGGEGFELHVNPYLVWAGNDMTICRGDSVILTADLSNWNQNDSTFVFWDNGQTGPSILVAPNATQTFTVTVTNGDGFFANDQVTVFVEQPKVWFFDGDGDGFGIDMVILACSQPVGYVDNPSDCDDNNHLAYPGAPEICNGADDNCDGQTDEGLDFVQSWRDLDGDSFGDPATSVLACTVPLGYVFNNADCDDQNPAVHPNAVEVCNGIDDNCNGQTDENTSVMLNAGLTGYFPFNGNAADVSPTSISATLFNTTLTNGLNAANSAYHFDGATARIDAGSDNRGVSNAVSLVAWIKTTEPANGQWVVGKYSFNEDKGYGLILGNSQNGFIGQAIIGGRDGTGNYHSSGYGSTKINDGNWHCLVGTAGNGSWKIYVDGILENSAPGSTLDLTTSSSEPLTMGWHTNPDLPLWLYGDLDDVRVYNRVLEDCEVDSLCSTGFVSKTTDGPGGSPLRIFPNPTTGTFAVELPEPAAPGTYVRILNPTGQILLEKSCMPNATLEMVRAESLSAGIYFIQVLSDGEVIAIEKFVKQ